MTDKDWAGWHGQRSDAVPSAVAASELAALTNAGPPPARRSRAATPSEKPPGRPAAPTTSAPSSSSIAVRTPAGTSAQVMR
ncbi:hypothetical protein AB0K16_09180 [Nonomuraea jabiensis]|uniref:hypothetical protein n=1 Tax=Nonomuraea jabiensis TaxID=882448 RepID=UPI0034243DD3